MVNRDGRWYVEYFGEEQEVLGVDADGDFVYLQGQETGLPAMMRYEEFEKLFLQKPLTDE